MNEKRYRQRTLQVLLIFVMMFLGGIRVFAATEYTQKVYVDVPANYGTVQCYQTSESTTKYRKIDPKTEAYTIYCTKYAIRSNGGRRFFFTSGDDEAYTMWFDADSRFTITYLADSISLSSGSSITIPYTYGRYNFSVTPSPSATTEDFVIDYTSNSRINVVKTGTRSFYLEPNGNVTGSSYVRIEGKRSYASSTLNVTITDPVAPTASVSGILTSGSDNTAFRVRFNVYDAIGINSVGVKVWPDGRSSLAKEAWNNSSGGFSLVGTNEYEYRVSYADYQNARGKYNIEVMAKDTSGNIGKKSFVYERVCNHVWNDGVVLVEPTRKKDGLKELTCNDCGETKQVIIPALEPDRDRYGNAMYDFDVTESRICAVTTDQDPAGSTYSYLQARASKVTAKTVKLEWEPVSGATSYVIFSARCAKGSPYKRVATVKGNSCTVKKLKKGVYYKFIVAAAGSGVTPAVSKPIHAVTKGGKYGNPKSVKVYRKSMILGVDKTAKIKATVKNGSLKVKKHRALTYETSDPTVAGVSAKGVVRGIAPGTCTIYAYAQNGVCGTIEVQVR